MTETILLYAAIGVVICVPIAIALELLRRSRAPKGKPSGSVRPYYASEMTTGDIEKLRRELSGRMGEAGYCEHCGTRGKCVVCGSEHGEGENRRMRDESR
jgi:hypothetical protein